MIATHEVRPLNLVYVNPTGALGGGERCLLDLLASIRSSRPDWSLRLVVGDDGLFATRAAELGVEVDVLPMASALAKVGDSALGRGSSRRRLAALGSLALAAPRALIASASYVRQLGRLLRGAQPDRVQSNGMKAHVLASWAAPANVPVIWQLQDFISGRTVMSRLLRQASRRGVQVVAASKAVAADARRVLGTKVAVDTVYSAIDLDRFAPGPADVAMLDRLAGLPPANPGTIRVGLVATYARWKGHGVFLEAARRVTAGVPIRFYIVGGPIYRSAGSQHSVDELRAQAVSLGLDLDTQLGFIGHQDDPAAILRALDVVVHASTQPEPFGRVIVEGMACGRAVIVSQAGGGAELFEPEISAIGTPPGDVDALANAITRLATDPDLRIRLGIAGRAEAVERFDRNRLAEEWERVYLNQNSRIAVRS